MKKLFSILLVAMLIVTSLATVAFAADSATVSASSVTAKPGDTVTISFTLSGGEFASYGMKISADPILTLTGIKQGAASNGAFVGNPNNGIVGMGAANNCAPGEIFTATFKVAANAKPGKYPVSVIMDFVSDEKQNDLKVSVVSGYVTITCDHIWGEWKTVVPATCSAEGKAERTCSNCGVVETKNLPKLTHNWGEWKTVVPATCSTMGKAERTCSNCGSVESKTLPTTAHNWGAWVTVKPATCSEKGLSERTCSICGEVQSKVLEMTAHSFSAWKTVVEPTCSTQGKAERTCSICGHKETKLVDKVPHVWGEWKTITPATCTSEGLEERVCSVGKETESRVIPKLAHDWSDWNVLVEATCTAEGKKERTCSVCGEVESIVIPALNHSAAEDWSFDENNHWHVCCNGCNEIFDLQAHELEWVITKNPTRTDNGLKHEECHICGYRGADVEIPADPDLDDVPPTGDIIPMVIAAVVALLAILVLVAYLIKRKFANNQF